MEVVLLFYCEFIQTSECPINYQIRAQLDIGIAKKEKEVQYISTHGVG